MNEDYKGGCFSLRVPPVFLRNGNLIAIPKGGGNRIYIYETLGKGEIYMKLPESNSVITSLKNILIRDIELLLTASYDGLLHIYIIDKSDKITTLISELNTGKIIIDMKISENNIYLLSKEKDNINDLSDIILFSINKKELFDKLDLNNEINENRNKKNNSIKKLIKKVVNFSYGGSSFYVSEDETLFCFIWKNILLIWSPKYSEKIIRFRHSEYILSLCLSYNKQFIVTGDAYGRLTYWFIPPFDSDEGKRMWQEAPLIKEKLDVDKMIHKYKIKTSTLHWHSHELISLNMIPETDVVLSGGEEAVIVLWRQNFSLDSYNNDINNNHNTGSRQFIPRLGAPIYTITTFKKNKINYKSINEDDKFDNLPKLIAGIVCSDNSIKILDLVHNRIINVIYGISTPFDMINKNYLLNYNTDNKLNLKIVNTKSLDLTKLLISIIGHPFKLHIHDLIKDNFYSSILCKPEESYVSKVGDGISSSKLVQNDVTRVNISNASFSNNGKYVLTVECQKFDHMNGSKRTYNLKFWKIIVINNQVNFELMSKYSVAHIDKVVSIEETNTQNGDTCFITITIKREIKCWIYKEQIKEWINLSIINTVEDINVYSTTFNKPFSKLFISSSNGIIVYNWNNRHSILIETHFISLPVKDIKINYLINCNYQNNQFLIGLSNDASKIFIWDINTMELIIKYDVEVSDNSKIIDIQNNTFNYLQDISFQFALIKDINNVSISLFNIVNKDNKISLHCIKEFNIKTHLNATVMDSIIQHRIYNSKVYIYLVLLLSSCDIYMELIDTIERSDLITENKNNQLINEDILILNKEEDESKIIDIQDSIEKMYLSIDDFNKNKSLSQVSEIVKNINSTSNSIDQNQEVIDSFSTLFCIKENINNYFYDKHYLSNLSKNLNTYMCPSSSNLFWSLINKDYTNSLNDNNKNVSIEVRNFSDNIKSRKFNDSNNGKDFDEILLGESLKPLQTHKLQSMLKKSLNYEKKDH